jgi:general secretion pathway protein F/type IV pilus assembly protein PilC
MAAFQYVARSLDGSRTQGVLQADSAQEAARLLDEKKLLPIRIDEVRQRRSWRRGGRVSASEQSSWYSQMSDLLGAGVPLLRSLDTVLRARTAGPMTEAIRAIRQDVASGEALAEAMAKQPRLFDPLHIAMVRAGERGAFLQDVLSNLAVFLERQAELRAKLRGALIYPALLVAVGVSVIVLALVVMVPKFKPMFAGVPLPLPTVVLFAVSGLLEHWWPVLLAGLALGGWWLGWFLKVRLGKLAWERFLLRLPVIGRTLRLVAVTRFCRILGTMLGNGVPLLTALSISKDATGNAVLGQSVEEAAQNVRSGEPLASPLRRAGLFPPEVIEMIAVAEESNQLEKVLTQIADTLERRTNRAVDQAVRLIEPVVLMIMAGAIGFVAVGLLYPVFTMARSLR